jgi:type II secretory pathway pseudopilin PulG
LQRIQVGLVGLATVLLVVTLANLIDSARKDSSNDATAAAIEQGIAGVANASATAVPVTTNEPLADLGVTPTADSAAPVVTPSVPDLQPDPRVRQRMDQDRDGPPAPPAH